MTSTLAGKTLFITGSSRGIGKAIALRAARDGANVVVAAKTAEAHPKLEGTIHTAVEEIEKAGGRGLAVQCDVRFEEQVRAAVDRAADHFSGIDVLVNNASAINLTDTQATPMKRFDLMHQVNARATFMTTQLCLPHLQRSQNPHVLTLAPPPELKAAWFAPHLAYTLSKYGMSLCVLGHAEEFRPLGIAVNALWPRTVIATTALRQIPGGDALRRRARTPMIMADAAHYVLTRGSRDFTGRFCVDEDVLREAGVVDFEPYAVEAGAELATDLFVD